MSAPSPPSSVRSTSTLSASAIVAHADFGSHILKIDGYSRTKGIGNGKCKCILSDKFDVGGHGWCVHYYPDGDVPDAADWISIYLSPACTDARGIKAEFKISLLDQDREPVPLYVRCSKQVHNFSTKEQSWGFRQFIKRKDLEESLHLRDDVFSIRCDVVVPKEIVTKEIVTVPVPPSDITQHLGQLLSAGDAADVTFDVGGETFAAHRCILAARSPVFKAELLGSMKEKKADHCVKIEDVEAKGFKALLHFSYTDSLPEMDEAETAAVAQHLLVAADKYNMDRLKLICEEKLCNRICSSTVATTLALAEQHGCGALKDACLKFLVAPGNLKAARACEGFDHLESSCPCVFVELAAKLAP